MHYAQEWLRKQTSIAEIEAGQKDWTDQAKESWTEFVSQMVKGDEIWDFSSPAETWQQLMGRAGYAMVRQGKVVDALMTRMN